MKLDLELVRTILLAVESTPANQSAGQITLPGVDEAEALEHLELLTERGLIEARITRSGIGGPRVLEVTVERLTWEGNDWLAAARNDVVWRKAMKLIKEKGPGVAFDLVKPFLVKVGLQQLGLEGAG